MYDVTEASEVLGVDEDTLMELADMARMAATLDSVVFTNSTDLDKMAEWMYEDKQRTAPIEFCYHVAEAYLPRLIDEGLVVDGQPTEEAIGYAHLHQAMLNDGHHLNG